MLPKPLRVFLMVFCHLLAILLLGPVGYGYSEQGSPSDFAIESQLLNERGLSYQASHQQPRKHLPDSPAELPAGKTEGDEENKEKDGFEKDSVIHRTLFYLPFTFHCLKSDSYFATVKVGGTRIPLFVLFQCWKSFLR